MNPPCHHAQKENYISLEGKSRKKWFAVWEKKILQQEDPKDLFELNLGVFLWKFRVFVLEGSLEFIHEIQTTNFDN